MNRGRARNPIKIQSSLLPDLTADAEPASLPFEDVIEITPNVCIQKDVCLGCNRGDRYGIPLNFILHFPDGKIQTVCYTCGKKVAAKIGALLPHTESDIEVEEAAKDARQFHIAIKKMDAKKQHEHTNV